VAHARTVGFYAHASEKRWLSLWMKLWVSR
jgi:hypothetical protein